MKPGSDTGKPAKKVRYLDLKFIGWRERGIEEQNHYRHSAPFVHLVDADSIIVLQAGRQVEQGTHAQLLGAQGVYAGVWRTELCEEDEETRPE